MTKLIKFCYPIFIYVMMKGKSLLAQV